MRGARALFAVAVVFFVSGWALGFGYPLGSLLSRGADGAFSLVFAPSVLAVLAVTLKQALASVALSVALGLPLGWLIGRGARRGYAWSLRALPLLAIPYGVPTLAVALTGVLWLGRGGWLARVGMGLDLAYSMSGVVVLHALLNIPLIALAVAQSRLALPEGMIEAARTLGASRLRRFLRIEWPWTAPALATSAIQVFQLCSASFALVSLFGGGPPVETLETGIVSAIKGGALDWPRACSLALWQIVITACPRLIQDVLEARRQTRGVAREASGGVARIAMPAGKGGLGFLLAFLLVVPYLGFLAAVKPGALSAALGSEEFAPALANSLAVALGSAVVATLWAASGLWTLEVAARRRPIFAAAARSLALLPSGVSLLVTGLGFWFAYSAWVDPFEGSRAAMISLMAVGSAPWLYRYLWPHALAIPRRELEAARTLGAPPVRAFLRVDGRRWRAPVAAAFAMAFAAAIGEVAAYSLFGAEGREPLPLLVARWMSQYRFDEAQALTAAILVLSGGVLGAVLAWGVRRGKEIA